MRLQHAALLAATLSLPACAELRDRFGGQREPAAPSAAASGARVAPEAERLPTAAARSVEEFDVTTAEERAAAAAAPAPGAERRLGTTVASLGDPAQPGFWLETPLVTETREGRVLYAETGRSAQLDLRPIPGARTAGSRISLAAMRLIGAPLTELPTVEVFAGGAGG